LCPPISGMPPEPKPKRVYKRNASIKIKKKINKDPRNIDKVLKKFKSMSHKNSI
jgi:hypothetical protein